MGKMKRKWHPAEREGAEKELKAKLAAGEISIGAAVREMRQRFLGFTLEEYAGVIGISKTTLLKIERDDPNVLRGSIETAIKPLGFSLTLVWTYDND